MKIPVESIYKKIKALCKIKKVTIIALEQQAGLGQNSIFKWDKSMPSADKLLKVAQCLGVSVDSILGNTPDTNGSSLADLKASTIEVVNVLEQSDLSETSTEILIDVIQSLKKHLESDADLADSSDKDMSVL